MDLDSDTNHISWNSLDRHATILNIKIEEAVGENAFDVVIGITPNGLVPATIIADLARTKVCSAVADELVRNPKFISPINSGEGRLGKLPRLLVVDAITSDDLFKIADQYKKAGHWIMTGSIYHPKDLSLKPDFFSRILEGNIILPWEN